MARTKIDRRIIKTRKAITNALLQLLSEKSLDEITITELTQRADVNRKTFYLHYNCINEVAEEINARLTADFLQGVVLATEDGNGFIPAKMFGYLNEKVNNDVDFFRAFCSENTSGHFLRVLQPVLLSSLLDAYRELFPEAEESKLSAVLIFAISGCFSLYFGWVRIPGGVSLEELPDTALKLTEAVIGTLK